MNTNTTAMTMPMLIASPGMPLGTCLSVMHEFAVSTKHADLEMAVPKVRKVFQACEVAVARVGISQTFDQSILLRQRDEIVATLRPFLDTSLQKALAKDSPEALKREGLSLIVSSLPQLAKSGIISWHVLEQMRCSADLVNLAESGERHKPAAHIKTAYLIGAGLVVSAAATVLIHYLSK